MDFSNFDHHSPDHRSSAERIWQELNSIGCPAWSEQNGGYYVIGGYETVVKANRDTQIFSSAEGVAIPDLNLGARLIPVEIDPPLQTEYRRLMNRFFTPRVAKDWEPMIRGTVIARINSLPAVDSIDIVDGFTRPFPISVAIEYLGFSRYLSVNDSQWLDRMIHDLLGMRGTEQAAAAVNEFKQFVTRFLDSRRREPDSGDLISAIVNGAVEGERLTVEQQESMVRLLLFGGFNTTTFTLSAALHWLAEHREDQERLRADPALLNTAVDEFVRYSSPGTYQARVTTRDTVVDGCPISSGSRAVLSYGAANHDPRAFSNADGIELDRFPNPHIGFGLGPHRCPGQHLARVEIRVALEELLSRLGEFAVDPDRTVTWVSGEAQGMTSLYLRFSSLVNSQQ